MYCGERGESSSSREKGPHLPQSHVLNPLALNFRTQNLKPEVLDLAVLVQRDALRLQSRRVLRQVNRHG